MGSPSRYRLMTLPEGPAAGHGQEVAMASARPSVTKRQREQKKRERKIAKAEKRAQRKLEGGQDDDLGELVTEESESAAS
jgi:hypothetical protein